MDLGSLQAQGISVPVIVFMMLENAKKNIIVEIAAILNKKLKAFYGVIEDPLVGTGKLADEEIIVIFDFSNIMKKSGYRKFMDFIFWIIKVSRQILSRPCRSKKMVFNAPFKPAEIFWGFFEYFKLGLVKIKKSHESYTGLLGRDCINVKCMVQFEECTEGLFFFD